EVWDRQLAAYGSEIMAARMELTALLAPHLAEAYQSIAPESQSAHIRYRSSLGEDMPEDLRATPTTADSGDASAPGHTAGSTAIDAGRLEAAMHTALGNVRE